MAHLTSPAAEKLLDLRIRVLDHGFVALVDYFGNDQRILQAARVSTGAGTKSAAEDRKLIFYLMQHRHTSPFEQVVLTIHARMPIFVARQWVRHRTARINEVSGRYSVLPSEAYLPDQARLGRQGQANKQGTGEELISEVSAVTVRKSMRELQEGSFEVYRCLIEDIDLARELARINLPLSTYTEWYWQIDLHNLFHFLKLRLDPHAQWELRQYAEQIAEFARAVAPVAYEAFEEHVLNAVTLSDSEADDLVQLLMLFGKNYEMRDGARRVYDQFVAKLNGEVN